MTIMTIKMVLVILGSPRKNGNSATLAKQVAAGAEAVGAEVESFYLHHMDIKPCTACEVCEGEEPGECTIDNDMRLVYPKLKQADALVMASPTYWFNVSAQTKLFVDRLHALSSSQGHAFSGRSRGIVLTYVGADPFISATVNALCAF